MIRSLPGFAVLGVRASVIVTTLLTLGLLMADDVTASPGLGGGGFGGGGFHGGSVGHAAHVNNHVGWGGYGPTPAFGETVDPIGWKDPPAPGAPQPTPNPSGAANSGGAVSPTEFVAPKSANAGLGWFESGNDVLGNTAAANAVIGTTVASLPMGYETIGVSGENYYYRNGTFYHPGASGYDVVAAPIGAEVQNAPADGKFVGIAGQQYFVYKDTYFQAFYSGSGPVYRVVKNPNG